MPSFYTFNSVAADIAFIAMHSIIGVIAMYEVFVKYGRYNGARSLSPYVWILIATNTLARYGMERSEVYQGKDDKVTRLSQAELIIVLIYCLVLSVVLWLAAYGQVEVVKRRSLLTRELGKSNSGGGGDDDDEDVKFVTPITGEVAYYTKNPETAQNIAEIHNQYRKRSRNQEYEDEEMGGLTGRAGSKSKKTGLEGCMSGWNAVRFVFVDKDPLPYRSRSEAVCDIIDAHVRWLASFAASYTASVAAGKLYGVANNNLPVHQAELLYILLLVRTVLFGLYFWIALLLDPRKFEVLRTFVAIPAFLTLCIFGTLYEALSNGGVTSLENNIFGIVSLTVYSGWFISQLTFALATKRIKVD